MEDESAPLLKERVTPLSGVSKWQSFDKTTGHHATANEPSATINVSPIT